MSGDVRKQELDAIARALSPEFAQQIDDRTKVGGFGGYLEELALHTAYAPIWTRGGLTPRERSLITVAILLALRQTEEIRPHGLLAISNGCTLEEIEELIYQAIPYAGFPAAHTARNALRHEFERSGLAEASQPSRDT